MRGFPTPLWKIHSAILVSNFRSCCLLLGGKSRLNPHIHLQLQGNNQWTESFVIKGHQNSLPAMKKIPSTSSVTFTVIFIKPWPELVKKKWIGVFVSEEEHLKPRKNVSYFFKTFTSATEGVVLLLWIGCFSLAFSQSSLGSGECVGQHMFPQI